MREKDTTKLETDSPAVMIMGEEMMQVENPS